CWCIGGRSSFSLSAGCPASALLICIRFFFHGTPPTEIYTLSLHDALPICVIGVQPESGAALATSLAAGSPTEAPFAPSFGEPARSEEHTSELQSLRHLVCRLLLEKKKKNIDQPSAHLDPVLLHHCPVADL